MIVDLPITEKMLGQVQGGHAGRDRRAGPGREPSAKVSRISPFLAAGSFTTTAEVEVDNPQGRLLPGMFVTADIATGESERPPWSR